MLLISFYKVVTQSKNNIPFYKSSTYQTHIYLDHCANNYQLLSKAEKWYPVLQGGRKTMTSEVRLEQGKGKDPDFWDRLRCGIHTGASHNQEGQEQMAKLS